MKINKTDNAQRFGAVYKLKVNASNLEQFENVVAPLYRSTKNKGIRAFVNELSEMYALTGKDAYEFDSKYIELLRNTNNSDSFVKKNANNVRYLTSGQKNFSSSFLSNKKIEPLEDFKKFLEKIFYTN